MKTSICKLASLHPTHVHDNHMSLQTNCTQCRTVGTLPILGFVSEETSGLEVLRSEIPSGMCAKLRTVAVSNNRDHAPQSLLLLLARAWCYSWCVSLHAHLVRGESHNQRNATGAVATEASCCVAFAITK